MLAHRDAVSHELEVAVTSACVRAELVVATPPFELFRFYANPDGLAPCFSDLIAKCRCGLDPFFIRWWHGLAVQKCSADLIVMVVFEPGYTHLLLV